MRPLRIGLVCPYALHVPGGVQHHVRDLAVALRRVGHHVDVLAPGDGRDPVDAGVTDAGRTVPVRYNGSVARVAFGPMVLARARRWLRAGGFDLLHVHEPVAPSVSLLALGLWDGPVVATFHTHLARSRALAVSEPVLRPALDKIDRGIAVSTHALEVVERRGPLAPPVEIIPNGLFVDAFDVPPVPSGPRSGPGPRLLFLGRFEEPRKGLDVALRAMPRLLERLPDARLVVAGAGSPAALARAVPPSLASRVEAVGRVDDPTRARLLAGADVYVAPQTGGESFGVVLLEAMAAGTAVVASDLPAFLDVLEHGRRGTTFPTGSPEALAEAVERTLADPGTPARVRAARQAVAAFDWSRLVGQVLGVYEDVLERRDATA